MINKHVLVEGQMHILKPLPISILEPKGKTAEIVNPMIAQRSDDFLSTEKTRDQSLVLLMRDVSGVHVRV